jgi:hypothetical protein
MAGVTNELFFEVLKQVQSRLDRVDFKIDEIKSELGTIRGYHLSMGQDWHNIYGILGRHELRFDRIAERLEISETPSLT